MAAIALLILPFTISATTCLTAFNAVRRDYRLDAPVFTVAAVLLLLRLTPPILGDQMVTVGHFALPGRGLAVLLAATVVVLIISAKDKLGCRTQAPQSTS